MPSADAILAGLSEAANAWRPLAVAWHLLLAALFVVLFAGWRLSTRLIAWTVIASIVSVSALSWLSKNPFNAFVFATLAIALALAARRTPGTAVALERPSRAITGVALVVFGWTYPHFLSTQSWMEYLYAAPLAVVPCATLSMAIGLALLVRGLRPAAWCAPLAAAGVLYGLVGVFALRVLLDVTLLLGALALAAVTALERSRRHVRQADERSFIC